MTENPSAADWASARGDKWLAHLAGMEATLQPVDAPLLRALRLDAPCRIADLGCGGGRTTRELLRRAPAGSSVHGFDISPALVAVARAADASSAIRFDTADVATAVHGPFDRLASRFGVMFFDDPPAAFANLRRWLASGGRFAFAVWGPTGDNPWMTTVRDTVAGFVDVPPPDPDAPGPFRYAKVDTLLGHLRHAGFADLAAHAWRGALPIGGGMAPAAAAAFALAALSSFGEQLAKGGEPAVAAARAALVERFTRHLRDGIVAMDAAVWIVTGGSAPVQRP